MSTGESSWQHPGYVTVLQLVTARAGLLTPSCPPSAMEGIQRAMARAGLTEDFTTYLERLEQEPALLDDLLVELTVGETCFFRNPEHFQFLRHTVLPEVQRRRGREHMVRAWSAGCSSGEEPYSLAVLLLEEGYKNRMAVWGTDVSRAALARAREGSYGDWSLRGPEAERIRAFLHPDGRRHSLSAELRGRVHFDYLNLAEDIWPSRTHGLWGMDVIFCRNVLIYFNRPTIEAVARRLFATLSEGGFLITGPSDPPLSGLAPFETLIADWGIAYHRPAPGRPPLQLGSRFSLVSEPHPASEPFPASEPPPRPEPPPPEPPPAEPPPPEPPPPVASAELEGARRAFAQGDWREAFRRASALPDDLAAATVAVRAMANFDAIAAVRVCAEAAARHPLSVELRYLEASLLLGLGRLLEAERAVRQALYLEPALAVASLLLGHILRRRGDRAGAVRAFETAESLCAALPPDTRVPLADGERAARLVEVARDERLRSQSPKEES